MKYPLLFTLLIFICSSIGATAAYSTPQTASLKSPSPLSAKMHTLHRPEIKRTDRLIQIEAILQLPYAEGLTKILNWPRPFATQSLAEIINSKGRSLQTRWRAVSVLAQINPAHKLIKRSLKSKHWYMRNAALLSLPTQDKKRRIKWARHLLTDPSMVVRASAVSVMRQLKSRKLRPDLVKSLNASQNFNKKRSLWIRKNIANALSDIALPEDKPLFKKLLQDKDVHLQAIARRTLSELGEPPGSSTTK